MSSRWDALGHREVPTSIRTGDRHDSSADAVLAYDTLREVRGAACAGMLVDGFAYAVVALTASWPWWSSPRVAVGSRRWSAPC